MRKLTALFLAALLVAIGIWLVPPAMAAEPGCSKEIKLALGRCPNSTLTDGTAQVGGTNTKDGSQNHSSGQAKPEKSSKGRAPDSQSYKETEAYKKCAAIFGGADSVCIPRGSYSVVTPAAPDGVDIPPITITDLASFSPAPGTLTGEPDNLGVAGLPTNFTTDAAAHTRTGTLFGYPVTARFTPASFVFRYGDGQTRTATTAGKTWEALRVPQFTPTDTSHTYAERGTYQASVDTVYTAEIDLGTGYFPISGTLTIPGPPQSIQIYEARTALVAHTCDEDPTAEGCPTR